MSNLINFIPFLIEIGFFKSAIVTVYPLSKSTLDKCKPRNPDPPKTRAFNFF